jgi:hypothetical protein
VQYQARPDAKSGAYQKHGGAYINCWIRADGPEEAGQIAAMEIHKGGWLIEGVEEPIRLETVPSESNTKYFEQAVTDGECYVFHTWPVTDHDDQSTH